MPPGRGRPRGSGATYAIPSLDLTAEELLPFRIGYELADTIPLFTAAEGPNLDPMFAQMTTAERRDLLRIDPRRKELWLVIGAGYRWLYDSIDKVRGL